MEINEFIKKFSETIDYDSNDLTRDTYFKELESYNSLTILSIIAFMDENFGLILSGKDIRDIDTIGDLFSLIENR